MNLIVAPLRHLLSHSARYRTLKAFASIRNAVLPGRELETKNRLLLAKLERGKDAPIHTG